jgi:hypothetical protein
MFLPKPHTPGRVWPRARCSSSRQLGKDVGQLAPHLGHGAVIVDGKGRSLRLLLLGELSCHTLVRKRVASSGGTLAAGVLIGDYGDGGIKASVHAGLEEQRYLDHGGAWRRCERTHVLKPTGDTGADQRPKKALKPPPLILATSERLGRDRGPVDDTPWGDILPPALDYSVAHPIVAVELVDYSVGGERLSAQRLKLAQGG